MEKFTEEHEAQINCFFCGMKATKQQKIETFSLSPNRPTLSLKINSTTTTTSLICSIFVFTNLLQCGYLFYISHFMYTQNTTLSVPSMVKIKCYLCPRNFHQLNVIFLRRNVLQTRLAVQVKMILFSTTFIFHHTKALRHRINSSFPELFMNDKQPLKS